MDVVWFSEYILRLRVRKRRFDEVKERLRDGKAVGVIQAALRACKCTNDHHYAREK